MPSSATTIRDEDGVRVVELEGEHDVATAGEVRAALQDDDEGAVGTVVVLSLATFIDSSILGALLGGLRRAREHGRGFAFVVGENGGQVGRTLELTGILAIFPVYRSLEEAVAAVRRGVNEPAGAG